MRTHFLLFVFLCMWSTASAQFQLQIPGGSIVGMDRQGDTLYFWGEDKVWMSLDRGASVVAIENVNSNIHGTIHNSYHAGSTSMSASVIAYDGVFWNHTVRAFGASISYSSSGYHPKTRKNIYFGAQLNPGEISRSGFLKDGLLYSFYKGSSYYLQYVDKAQIQQNYKWNLTHINQYFSFYFYHADGNFVIGQDSTSLFKFSMQDSVLTRFGTYISSLINNQTSFSQIDAQRILVLNNNGKYAVLNTDAMSIDTIDSGINIANGVFNSTHFILFRTDSSLVLFDIDTKSVVNTMAIPHGFAKADLHFLGTDCIALSNKSDRSFAYTADLGASWLTHVPLPIISHKFQYLMEDSGYVYAISGQDVFRQRCDSLSVSMQKIGQNGICDSVCATNTFANSGVYGNIYRNLKHLGTTLFRDSSFSFDFGKTWQAAPAPTLFLDYESKVIYWYHLNAGGFLAKSNDFGLSWTEISVPAFQPTLSGVVARADTIIFCNQLSLDGGLTWSQIMPIGLNVNLVFQNIQLYNGAVIGAFSNGIRKIDIQSGVSTYLPFGTTYPTTMDNERGQGFQFHHFDHNNNPHKVWQFNDEVPYDISQNRYFSQLTDIDYSDLNMFIRLDGLTDHFYYQDEQVYYTPQQVRQLSACKTQINHQGVTLNAGVSYPVFSAAGCGVDTVIKVVNVIPAETRNFTRCEGDTIYLAGRAITKSGTYLDTIIGIGQQCDTIRTWNLYFQLPVYTGQTLRACPSQTVTFMGNTYTTDTIVFTPVLTDTLCNSQYRNTIYFLPISTSDTVLMHLCTSDSVLLYGKYRRPPFMLDTAIMVSPNSQPKCNQHIVICTEDLLRNDTLFSQPISICTDSVFTFAGQSYTAPAYVPTQLNISALCGGSQYTPLVAVPNQFDTLPVTTFCISTGIVWNGVFYNQTIQVTYPDPATPCHYLVKPLVQLPCFTTNGYGHEMSAPSHNGEQPNTPAATETSVITIVPNPASDHIMVNAVSAANFHLRDQLGREVLMQKFTSGQTYLSIAHLPEGIYSWRVTDAGGVHEGKLVVARR
jgi:hypothetical protein